ncbi:hypothetical protein N7468_003417 [Penicillium chermesinum]|uniref:Uncharacterized protein n=1 Tax=Penicillium chermesinum TaxID=63820 RepID=A0A9W9P911_9EURO|nr:uncharacterized protein N7468_003417 [Penicillium chermesinum]KAJ5238798.1 hypothetical protein N7468_003417 [Penicillium chermesinum]KAJ6164437.1 hypothetical protein N7470_003109 [Penicillium chermesinum]
MVAVPMIGAGPYGTSPKSARSSATSVPKIDAAQIEDIFQSVHMAQEPAQGGSSRFGWFSRKVNKLHRRKSESTA